MELVEDYLASGSNLDKIQLSRFSSQASLLEVLDYEDRIRETPVWPFSLQIRRFVGVGILPLLAWTAAALIETVVSDVVG